MAGGNDNLIPMNERTKDEQREIATAGGIASGKARRRKRTLRELAEILAERKVAMPQLGGGTEEMTYDVAMIQRQYQKAIDEGDTQAAKYLTNLLGEENVLQQTINVYNVKEETAKKMQDLEQMDV